MSVLDQDIAFATIAETAELVRSREISPVELTQAMLRRIEQYDPQLHAFVTVTDESALEQAKQAERDIMAGQYRGPLHGIPIVHKDIVYTAGIRTTASSKLLEQFVPDHSATVAERLAEAGTVLLGKVHTMEFACGDSPTRNPWNTDRSPGGSSSGTGASVAAGLAFMGTGTDTGGSIRFPAAYCGIVGMKPTYGRVSRHGIFPLGWSLDHAGPITRSVKDAAISLQAMAGYDPRDPSTAALPVPDYASGLRESLEGVKIGIPSPYYDDLDPDVGAAVEQSIDTMTKLGAVVVPLDLPVFDHAAGAQWAVMLSEMASIHDEWFETRASEYGPALNRLLPLARDISAVTYLRAQRARQQIRRQFLEVLEGVDALITPTAPNPAPLFDQPLMKLGCLTMPTNAVGLPSLALPCGFSSDGMPVSMQIIGRPFDETTVFAVGHAYEMNTEWHDRHPSL